MAAATARTVSSCSATSTSTTENLREQAAKYGFEDEIDALLRYLETHGEVDDERLPEGQVPGVGG